MSTWKNTSRGDYHTPEKVIKPDGNVNTHLKSTTPPTIEPSRLYTAVHNPHHFSIDINSHSNDQNLKETLFSYEQKINILKNYVHSSDSIEREQIINIFGFDYPCCKKNTQESKIVLKELSSKVKDLIRQNNRLRQSGVGTTTVVTKQTNTTLLSENSKLKSLLDEYRRSENQSLEKLRIENYQLKKQIQRLRQQNNKEPVIIEKTNTVQVGYSPQDVELIKKNLTKQMFEYSQEIQAKNKNNILRITHLEERIQKMEHKLGVYQKERKIKIDSTIRKSFVLSQSLMRPIGDVNNVSQEQVKLAEFTSKIVPRENLKASSIRKSEEKDAIQEMKIKSLHEENIFLKQQIRELNFKLNSKIERIIQLENILQKIENQRSSSYQKMKIVNPQLENQVRIIKQTLASCNITNFELFFKEFNEIIQQRDLMKNQIDSQKHSVTYFRGKQMHHETLQNKINNLTEENKGLLKKVGELEAQVDKYHMEIIQNQLEKLNDLNINLTSGKQAIQWQRKVKACIETSVIRLDALQKKIGTKQIRTPVIVHSKVNPN